MKNANCSICKLPEKICKKTKSSSVFLHQSFFGRRGWTSRAAHLKKPRRGFFTRRTVRRVDAVRIHPCVPFFKADKTETPVPGSDTGVLGGRGWIRTTEAEKQQIYSLSPLATREHAQIQFTVVNRLLIYVTIASGICQLFFHLFLTLVSNNKKRPLHFCNGLAYYRALFCVLEKCAEKPESKQ